MGETRIKEERTKCEKGKVNKKINQFLLEKLKELGEKADFILYKHNEVVIGKIHNNDFFPSIDFFEKYIKEMRVFNEKGEIHIWWYNGEFCYRLRIDGEDDKTNVYDEEHIIWGEEAEQREKSTLLKEKRGTNIELPYKISDDDLPIKYKIRNYFTYDNNGLIKFFDARLLYFMKANEEVLSE